MRCTERRLLQMTPICRIPNPLRVRRRRRAPLPSRLNDGDRPGAGAWPTASCGLSRAARLRRAPESSRGGKARTLAGKKSIDYAIVLSGEIDMLLDDTEVHLRAGDVLVQQGTNHAWENRSGATCRIAFVLIDAAPPAGIAYNGAH
jgi:cupin domain